MSLRKHFEKIVNKLVELKDTSELMMDLARAKQKFRPTFFRFLDDIVRCCKELYQRASEEEYDARPSRRFIP